MVASSPNILLVMADQLAPQFLPAYGHPIVQAPAITRLANEGVVFDAAYTNSPLCGPSRAAMLTGNLGSATGVYDNASEFPASSPTFVHSLRQAGYHTSLVGKMHFVGPDQLHGFEERLTTDIYPADFGWTPDWEHPGERFDWWYHNMDSVERAGVVDSSNQLDFDDEVGFHAIRKLRDLGRSKDDRPWFVAVSFTHPHDPYLARREHWDRYDHASIDLPRIAGPDDPDPHSARLRQVSNMDAADITDDEVRNARHAYYGAISYIDDWVARLTETLQLYGLADDTIVIFTADHGDMLGERGLWYKMTFFEHAARVPLVIRVPGQAGQTRVPEPVSLADLGPTILGLAGVAGPDVHGTDAGPLMAGHREPERVVYGEYLAEGAAAPLLMVRKGSFKYVYCPTDPPQLFDLATDPDELVNLAEHPESSEQLDDLHALMLANWDPQSLHQDVLASQRNRRLVNRALRTGPYIPWDYDPPGRGTERFMRNHLDLNEVEAGRRFPP